MSFIYKYAPTLETFELEHKEVLAYSSHMLLLGGERTGKTTLTALLVSPGDHVMHITNLKDQGIQYIRNEVKSFCQLTTSIPKKMIVDGLDELLEQTQQILLTYLDKYGHQVKFIATASNPHKVVESFFSRFITVKLSPPSPAYMTQLVHRVVREENMSIRPDAVVHLVRMCGSNVRSMLNYLEKYKYVQLPITVERVTQCHNDMDKAVLQAFTDCLVARDQPGAFRIVLQWYEDGFSIMDIMDAYYDMVQEMPESVFYYQLVKIICKYITIFNNIHEHHIELLFFVDDCINIANASRSECT